MKTIILYKIIQSVDNLIHIIFCMSIREVINLDNS